MKLSAMVLLALSSTSAAFAGETSIRGSWTLSGVGCAVANSNWDENHALKHVDGAAVIDAEHIVLTYQLKTYLDSDRVQAAMKQMTDVIVALEKQPSTPENLKQLEALGSALDRFHAHRTSVKCQTKDVFPYARRGDELLIGPSTGRLSDCPGEGEPDKGGSVARLVGDGDVLVISSSLPRPGTCRADEGANLYFSRTSL